MNIVIFPFAKYLRENKDNKPHPKNYPFWKDLIKLLQADGHSVIQVGVVGEEQLVPDFFKNLPIDQLSSLVKMCDTWISVDSFGQHLGWDLGKKGIVLFGQSDPNIFGHPENINLLKDRKYLREKQFFWWEQAQANDDCWVTPEEIMEAVAKF